MAKRNSVNQSEVVLDPTKEINQSMAFEVVKSDDGEKGELS